MIEFDTTVRINQTPERVFAVLADFETYLPRWATGPVAAVRTAGGGGVGTCYTITARVGPAKFTSPYEVTAYEPPERLSGDGVAGPVRFHETYQLAPEGGTTVLIQSISATPRGPFRVAERLIDRQLRRLIASDLERLADLVVSEHPPG